MPEVIDLVSSPQQPPTPHPPPPPPTRSYTATDAIEDNPPAVLGDILDDDMSVQQPRAKRQKTTDLDIELSSSSPLPTRTVPVPRRRMENGGGGGGGGAVGTILPRPPSESPSGTPAPDLEHGVDNAEIASPKAPLLQLPKEEQNKRKLNNDAITFSSDGLDADDALWRARSMMPHSSKPRAATREKTKTGKKPLKRAETIDMVDLLSSGSGCGDIIGDEDTVARPSLSQPASQHAELFARIDRIIGSRDTTTTTTTTTTSKTRGKTKISRSQSNSFANREKWLSDSEEEDDGDEADRARSSSLVASPKKRWRTASERAENDARRREERAANAASRQANKEHRAMERQAQAEEKKRMREALAEAKRRETDVAEVNKRKTDRKLTTPEMIVDMSDSFSGSQLAEQVSLFMAHHNVQTNLVPTPMPNVVSWRRKVQATFNTELGHWEPCPFYIAEEPQVLCYMTASAFTQLITGPETIDCMVRRVQTNYPGCKQLYLIEGLAAYMRKNHNSANRAYRNAVLQQFSQQQQSEADNDGSSQGRRKATSSSSSSSSRNPPVLDDDTIEDALLSLQVKHSCLIHHTAAAIESAEWMTKFTENISLIPYRRPRQVTAVSFCMDVGQVKTGADKFDTYVKMLQEVQRVTKPMAVGIATEFPNVRALINGFKAHGPLLLQGIDKGKNKDGTISAGKIGSATSQRLYKVFMSADPDMTDI